MIIIQPAASQRRIDLDQNRLSLAISESSNNPFTWKLKLETIHSLARCVTACGSTDSEKTELRKSFFRVFERNAQGKRKISEVKKKELLNELRRISEQPKKTSGDRIELCDIEDSYRCNLAANLARRLPDLLQEPEGHPLERMRRERREEFEGYIAAGDVEKAFRFRGTGIKLVDELAREYFHLFMLAGSGVRIDGPQSKESLAHERLRSLSGLVGAYVVYGDASERNRVQSVIVHYGDPDGFGTSTVRKILDQLPKHPLINEVYGSQSFLFPLCTDEYGAMNLKANRAVFSTLRSLLGDIARFDPDENIRNVAEQTTKLLPEVPPSLIVVRRDIEETSAASQQ